MFCIKNNGYFCKIHHVDMDFVYLPKFNFEAQNLGCFPECASWPQLNSWSGQRDHFDIETKLQDWQGKCSEAQTWVPKHNLLIVITAAKESSQTNMVAHWEVGTT